MKQHISDRKQFSTRRLEWPKRPNSTNSFGIQELLARPQGAPYVRELLIRGDARTTRRTALAEPQFGRVPLSIDIQEWRDFFAVSNCPYVPSCDVGDWEEKLEDFDVMAVAGMLLALLPHLEMVTLQRISDTTMLAKIARKIDEANRRRGSTLSSGVPLSKLSTLYIYGGSANICTTGLLQSIIMSPAMHSLRVDPGKLIKSEAWPLIQGRSNLKAVNLESAEIHPEHIWRLLSRVVALEKFEYEYADSFNYYHPAAVVRMLETYASHSLVYLNLTQGLIWLDNEQERVECLAGSLRNFKKLRKVIIDIGMLAYVEAGKAVFAPLIDLLPISLQDLHIKGDIATFMPLNAENLFVGITSWKRKRKTCLRSIKYHSNSSDQNRRIFGLSRGTRKACEASGIFVTWDEIVSCANEW